MEVLSATAVENEALIKVGKRIKPFIGREKAAESWLTRGVKNRIIGYIQKDRKKGKKTSRERGKKVTELRKERVAYSSLDSSYDICGCNTSIEGNNGSSDNISSNICSDDQGGNCGSDSDSDTDKQDGIIETTLCRYPGLPLGFKVIGGSNTPQQYICIQSLIEDTPASDCGLFCKGDQLVMVGDTCMIGMTWEEANLVLEQAPPVVKVIAQRKLVPMVASDSQADKCSKDRGKGKGKAGGVATTSKCLQPVSSQDLTAMKSSSSQGSTRVGEGGSDHQATTSVKADKQEAGSTARSTGLGAPMVVDFRPNPGEMLGIGITGGISDPYLKNIHVKRLIPNGVVARDGRIKKGDCVLSVNGHSLAGLTKKEAAQLLKEATGHVTLVIRRLEEPEESVDSNSIPLPSIQERETCSEQLTAGTKEMKGAEKAEKSTYSAILSWMGKKGIQQAAEKIGKLVGETTASLGAFGGNKRKSSSQSNEEVAAGGTPTCSILRLEDECDTFSENSEPGFDSPVDPEVTPQPLEAEAEEHDPEVMTPQPLEAEEHDPEVMSQPLEAEEHDHTSSMTSYTEVYTESVGDSRRSSLHYSEVYTESGGNSRKSSLQQGQRVSRASSVGSHQGIKAVLKEYRRRYPESKELTDLQQQHTSDDESIDQALDRLSGVLSQQHDHFKMGQELEEETPSSLDLSPSSSDASEYAHLIPHEGVSTASVYKTVEEDEERLLSNSRSTSTHSSSEEDSMPASTVYGHAEKMQLPIPWSSHHNYYPQESSEDVVLGQNRAATPAYYSKKRLRNSVSVNPQGEVLTFRDQKSTLPRRVAGNRDNLRLVELRKGAGWLGIQLQGGADPSHMTQPAPIYVQTIVRGGAAYRSGMIRKGDEIIEVNGISLANMTLRQAVDTVRQQPKGSIFFILRESIDYGYGCACRKKLF